MDMEDIPGTEGGFDQASDSDDDGLDGPLNEFHKTSRRSAERTSLL